jgi:hypothetical protein
MFQENLMGQVDERKFGGIVFQKDYLLSHLFGSITPVLR